MQRKIYLTPAGTSAAPLLSAAAAAAVGRTSAAGAPVVLQRSAAAAVEGAFPDACPEIHLIIIIIYPGRPQFKWGHTKRK